MPKFEWEDNKNKALECVEEMTEAVVGAERVPEVAITEVVELSNDTREMLDNANNAMLDNANNANVSEDTVKITQESFKEFVLEDLEDIIEDLEDINEDCNDAFTLCISTLKRLKSGKKVIPEDYLNTIYEMLTSQMAIMVLKSPESLSPRSIKYLLRLHNVISKNEFNQELTDYLGELYENFSR